MLPAALLPMLSNNSPATYPRALPTALELTVTPLFNRIAVQLTESETLVENTTIEGHVDIRKNGVWHNGTELFRSYGTDDYYANCFNLLENTRYRLRIIIRLRDTTTQEVIKQYVHHFVATTLNSNTPQATAGGNKFYVDPVDGHTPANGGTGAVGNPFKWLNDRGWQPGDTIVIMNGNFAGASFLQRALNEVHGTPDNWIRVVPYSAVDPINGDPDKERFFVPVALNGPWDDEGDGVWSMPLSNTHRLMGVVRDEATGWQLYHHNSLDSTNATEPGILVGYDPADFPQLGGDHVQGWYIVTTENAAKVYLRTYDGNEPEDDRYIGGYWTGLSVRECSYISVEDFTFEMLGNMNANGTAFGSNRGILVSSADNNDCHHVYVKRCTFKDCIVGLTSTSGQTGTCRDILIDAPTFLRKGPKEYFIDRVDYSDSDPYDSDLGYHPVKGAFWGRVAVQAQGVANLTIRNPNVYGYDLHQDSNSATFGDAPFHGGKHLDLYGGSCSASVLGVVEFGGGATGFGLYVNAALWNMRIDDSAEPIAMSPNNSGPVWMFALHGDGVLHTPFKIGLQFGDDYSTANGHGFKIIANTSFGMAGHTTTEGHGMQRFQGAFSGVRAANNVLKGYQSTETSPLGDWFSYADPFGDEHLVAEGRTNVWDNGIIYIRNKTGSTVRPKLRWDDTTYDPRHPTTPTHPDPAEIVWSNYTLDWSAREGSVDPFPTSVAAGLNPAITTKSVYVRGITDLAGDGAGNAVAMAELRIGCFPLRAAE